MRPVPNSLHDEVASRLREQIFWRTAARQLSGRGCAVRAAGDFAHLLREALKVLVAEGLLRHEPRRGCFVAEVTRARPGRIFPVIALLEGRAAHEATQKASSADVAALETLHQRLQQCASEGRIPDYYAANHAIHEAFITLADNRWLAQVIGDLRKILRLARLQQLHARRAGCSKAWLSTWPCLPP